MSLRAPQVKEDPIFALIEESEGVITWEQGCAVVAAYESVETIDVLHGLMHKFVIEEQLVVLFTSSLGSSAIMNVTKSSPVLARTFHAELSIV